MGVLQGQSVLIKKLTQSNEDKDALIQTLKTTIELLKRLIAMRESSGG